MKIFNKRLFLVGVLLCSAVLTGCASTFSSKINTVNQLPASLVDKSYSLAEHPEQSKEAEYQHASEDLKAGLKELGFSEVDVSKAALKVTLQLISIPGDVHVSTPFGPLSYIVTPSGMVIPLGGLGAYYYSPRFARYPYPLLPRSAYFPRGAWSRYSPTMFGRLYDPFFGPELNVRQYFDHGVEITITEVASGKLLYSVKAKTNKTNADIDPYVALLIESALRNFPNKTGDSEIEFKLEK
jgi:hypothetical protein